MTTNQQQPDRKHNLLTDLPQQTKVGVYARGTTKKNYRRRQVDDGIALARELGWTDEQIIPFQEDCIPPGILDSDKYEGLSALVTCIARGEIKAVIVSNEARLFRDATGIEANVFIRLCQEHTVFVITRQTTYDFTNPFLVKLFRAQRENG